MLSNQDASEYEELSKYFQYIGRQLSDEEKKQTEKEYNKYIQFK